MLFTPEQQRAGRKLPVFAAVFGVLQCSFFLSASELTVIQSETIVTVVNRMMNLKFLDLEMTMVRIIQS